MLPARKRTSPSPSAESCFISSSTFFSGISGPCPLISLSSCACTFPLISVPSILFNLTLMREYPSSSQMQPFLIPIWSSRPAISFPVKPARNPSAVLSIPRFPSTVDTLIPFPPGSISSELVRLVRPSLKSSTDTM